MHFHVQVTGSEDSQTSLLRPRSRHGSNSKPVRIGSKEHMEDTVDYAEKVESDLCNLRCTNGWPVGRD